MLPTTSSSSSSSSSSSLASFIYALKTSGTQKEYLYRLNHVFNFLGLPGTVEEQAAAFLKQAKSNNDSQWTQDIIIGFINYQKQKVQRKELAAGTLHNYYCAIKLFYEMNDLDRETNWRRISRGLPRMKATANDRAPTIEEIRRLVEYPDRRIKAIVYTMASSGIRLGAWANEDLRYYLRWKHVTPITNDQGDVIAAKLLVYEGEPEEYYTFITPEAYHELKKYMDFRKSLGEKIDDDSPLIRDKLPESNAKQATKWGLVTNPQPLQIDGIKKILNRALWVQGLRKPLIEGKRRHEWKTSHGFRKFFKTRAEQVMRPLNVELLLSHESGISDYYYRPTEQEVLDDYLKAVDSLTINDQRSTLLKVKELTEKNKQEVYALKGQLAEKAKEAEQARKALEEFGNKQTQFQEQVEKRLERKLEEDMIAKFEKYADQALRRAKPTLRKIKDEKKRNVEESQLLWDAGVAAEVELEEEEEEEDWKKAQAAVSVDDPLLNDIDCTTDLEIMEEQKEQEEN